MLLGKAGNFAVHSCCICRIGRLLSTDLSQFPRKAGLPRLQQCMLHAHRIMGLGGSRPCISAGETSPHPAGNSTGSNVKSAPRHEAHQELKSCSKTRGPPRAQVYFLSVFLKTKVALPFFLQYQNCSVCKIWDNYLFYMKIWNKLSEN